MQNTNTTKGRGEKKEKPKKKKRGWCLRLEPSHLSCGGRREEEREATVLDVLVHVAWGSQKKERE